MVSKLMMILASMALLVMFTDSQTIPVESSTDPSTEPTTVSPLIKIQQNLCAAVEVAIDAQCLNEAADQTYVIRFNETSSKRQCKRLSNDLTKQNATVSIRQCRLRRSSRLQTVLNLDQLRYLCKHRFAELFTCLREPEPGQEDLCPPLIIQEGSCPGNEGEDKLSLCRDIGITCFAPGRFSDFCYCPQPDETCA